MILAPGLTHPGPAATLAVMRGHFSIGPVVVTAGLVFTLGSCRRPPEAARNDPSQVVAEVDGKPITLQEVDRRAASPIYEARQQAMEELIQERLLNQEAAARGLTREALLKAEVEERVPLASPEEVTAVYERNRPHLGERTLEELKPEIERSLRERSLAERSHAWREELRHKAQVRVMLKEPRAEVAVTAEAPTLGPVNARVTFVEFLDYRCQYCQRVQGIVDQVMSRYPGQVRFVHREFLLGSTRALPAARAARCAGEQGRFWEYHRALLVEPGDMGDQDLGRRASALGLNRQRFASCLASDRHDAAIRNAVEQGKAVGVSATPTFFINGRRIVGVRTLPEFQKVIDEELRGAS